MAHGGYNKELLDERKKKFHLAVLEASEALGVSPPVVKVWDCPTLYSGVIAHCHTDRRMICITETSLMSLPYEDMRNTANHEVAHLKHADHSSAFHSANQDLNANTWRPPSGMGIQSYSETDLKRPVTKSKQSKPDNKECNYYQAKNHRKGKLEKCEYCDRYFCSLHINPRPARAKDLGDYNKLSQDLHEEANNPKSHPCMGYNIYFEGKTKEQNKKWGETLDVLLPRRSKRYLSTKSNESPREDSHVSYVKQPGLAYLEELDEKRTWREEKKKKDEAEDENDSNKGYKQKSHKKYTETNKSPEEPYKQERPKKKETNSLSGIVALAIVLILIIAACYSYLNLNQPSAPIVDQDLEKSNAAFNLLNEFRNNNALLSFVHDENAKNMALALAKRYLTGYTSVDETLKKNFTSQFDVGGNVALFVGVIDETQGYDVDYMVARWKNLGATRENLLNSTYTRGAVSCYQDTCYYVISTS